MTSKKIVTRQSAAKHSPKKKTQINNSEGVCIENFEQMALGELVELLNKMHEKGDVWILVDSYGVIFNIELVAVFPDFFDKAVNIQESGIRRYVNSRYAQKYGAFSGFRLMSLKECRKAFLNSHLNKNYYRSRGFNLTQYITVTDDEGWKWLYDGNRTINFKTNNTQSKTMYIPMHCLLEDKSGDWEWNSLAVAIEMVKNNLLPKAEKYPELIHYQDLLSLFVSYEKGCRDIYENGKITLKEPVDTSNTLRENDANNGKKTEKLQVYEKELLECDKRRFNSTIYSRERLYDDALGVWDSYNSDNDDGRGYHKDNNGIISRNPVRDVQRNGVVAIDFGTKSTVVVIRNSDNKKIALRIGTSKFNKDISENQYENPTVEEFVNIKSFLDAYNSKDGRPETEWKNLIVANQAANDMIDNASVLKKYYSFFSSIKQWAAGITDAVITDQAGYDLKLDKYITGSCEIDLVEIYAYFIGMHINNMQNGIFLNYRLSFPVSYDKEICEKIRDSFEKGIKKSIPMAVQNDKIFKKYKIKLTASEPAAYVASAIQAYHIDVASDEAIFYGVFDFGGGTSDFDFGLWSECNDEDSHFSYVLEELYSGGDMYLGGENLLELLAYEMFKKNRKILREKNISFYRPAFCERFSGDELVVSNPPSRISRRNMYIMKEKLRKFWEGDYLDLEKKARKIQIDLLANDEKPCNNVELEIDYNKLFGVLKNRIEQGVEKFKSQMNKALEKMSDLQKKQYLKQKRYIFLAGNSCKSSIVKELISSHFSQEINKGEIEIKEPLQGEIADGDINLFMPTGKTGVAGGLIDIGDSIKFIESELAQEGKISFKYYLGIAKKDRIVTKLGAETEYNVWKRIVRVEEDDYDVTLYFTNNILASENGYSINEKDVSNFVYDIAEPEEGMYVYARSIDSKTIELVAAKEEDITQRKSSSIVTEDVKLDENKLSELKIVKIDLSEI